MKPVILVVDDEEAIATLQPDDEADSERLGERNITYAPDYVINAGGLMSVYSELNHWPGDKAMSDADFMQWFSDGYTKGRSRIVEGG